MHKILTALLSLWAFGSSSQELTYFSSRFLGEKVPYRILKSDSIKSNDTYDLLILLDGDEYAGIARNMLDLYEFAEKIPPTIVVALPSTRQSRWKYYTPTKAERGNDGITDELYTHTGKFSVFADFIEKELLPGIQEEHQIFFDRKTIYGHSMGGLAVLSFLILRPQVFGHFICASPSTMYDQHYILKRIENRSNISYQALYLSAAENDASGYRENVLWLNEFLEKNRRQEQKLKCKVYQGETHATSGVKSLVDGLIFLNAH